MATIIKDNNLTRIGDSVKPDGKRRVHLPKVLVKEGITYHIYANSIGQIVLDPQVTIPASEVWVFENKDILAKIDKGMTEEKSIKLGSFAKYIKNAT
jgi:hypothetical protein